MRSVERGGVLARDVERRALVERERDVGAERGLDLHRGLRPHEALAPVDVGAEPDALLLDRQDAAVRRLAPLGRAALDLLGDRAVPHREHLEATRVGDDRAAPAHELVQAAHPLDVLVPGLDEQVERVAEHHLVPERGHLVGLQRLDGRGRRQRHERRRVDVTVRGPKNARAG